MHLAFFLYRQWFTICTVWLLCFEDLNIYIPIFTSLEFESCAVCFVIVFNGAMLNKNVPHGQRFAVSSRSCELVTPKPVSQTSFPSSISASLAFLVRRHLCGVTVAARGHWSGTCVPFARAQRKRSTHSSVLPTGLGAFNRNQPAKQKEFKKEYWRCW